MGWIVIKRSNYEATVIIGIEKFYLNMEKAKRAAEELGKDEEGWWDYYGIDIV